MPQLSAQETAQSVQHTRRAMQQQDISLQKGLAVSRLCTEQVCRARVPQPCRKQVCVLICTCGRIAVQLHRRCSIVTAGETALLREPSACTLYVQNGCFSGVLIGADASVCPGLRPPENVQVYDSASLPGSAAETPEQLALYLSKLSLTKPLPESPRTVPLSQFSLALKAYALLSARLGQHIPIKELADALHISPTHLKNSFRMVYGDSLYAYMRTQKMLAAAETLRETNRTVLDIAGEFGYDNGSKFARAFQKVLGVTPREFRMNADAETVSTDGQRRHGALSADD